MAEDLGEKTEEATPHRLQEAREEGNVAKSQDFAAATMLAAVTFLLWLATMHMVGQGRSLVSNALDGSILGNPIRPGEVMTLLRAMANGTVALILPLLLGAWLVAALSHVGQTGWMFSPKSVAPKLSKLNPLNGAKRIFGIQGLVKATIDFLKVMVVVLVVVLSVLEQGDHIVVLPNLTAWQGLVSIGRMMFEVAIRVLAVLLLLGLIDLLYQRSKFRKDMRMSKQQVKDEMKQTEGDPDVKRRRLRMQQQVAMQRIGAAVPKADVIVTNPEHISIAIQYDQDRMGAPKVIAKGADYIALRIRQLARQHSVPIVERKPLARALYRSVPVGQEVPPEFYQAIAEILAYVYRLDGSMAG